MSFTSMKSSIARVLAPLARLLSAAIVSEWQVSTGRVFAILIKMWMRKGNLFPLFISFKLCLYCSDFLRANVKNQRVRLLQKWAPILTTWSRVLIVTRSTLGPLLRAPILCLRSSWAGAGSICRLVQPTNTVAGRIAHKMLNNPRETKTHNLCRWAAQVALHGELDELVKIGCVKQIDWWK